MSKQTVNQRFIFAINYLVDNNIVKNKTDISIVLGSSRSKFSEILKERMNVGVDMISSLVLNYNISSDWLITGKEPMVLPNASNTIITQKDTCLSCIDKERVIKAQEKLIASLEQQLVDTKNHIQESTLQKRAG